MDIPLSLLRHVVLVEPYLGHSGTGPRYGAPVTVPCFIDRRRRAVRGSQERQLVAASTIYTRLDAPVTVEARVSVDGRPAEVLTIARHDGGRLPVPSHLEITIQ